MQREKGAFCPGAAERVDAGVAPHIAAVATIAAELDMVLVRVPAMLEQEHELVLAAVERAHAGIVLGPDAQVLQLAIGACQTAHNWDPGSACKRDPLTGVGRDLSR